MLFKLRFFFSSEIIFERLHPRIAKRPDLDELSYQIIGILGVVICLRTWQGSCSQSPWTVTGVWMSDERTGLSCSVSEPHAQVIDSSRASKRLLGSKPTSGSIVPLPF